MSLLQKFSENKNGRDYVCSDIHGHFSILQAKLGRLKFDERSDRLFSLGDLIDRGDESANVLEWLDKPWFYAIQGNHERMLVNAFEGQSDSMRFQWFHWGGDWAEDMNHEALEPFYHRLSQLPVAIELELDFRTKVALVHAELPDVADWIEVKVVLDQAEASSLESNTIISNMLWRKSQLHGGIDKMLYIEPVTNIAHVFHGHTIVDDILTIGNRSFIDLGSYRTGEIGVVDIKSFLGSRNF